MLHHTPSGQLATLSLPTGLALTYGYDAAHRLTGQTTSRSYTLPATGNRATGFSQTIGSTTSTVSYAYNANGDLTGDGLNSFSYDAEGRMNNASAGRTDSSPTSRYVYNALGQRVFKTVPVYPAQNTVGTDLTAFQSRGWNPSGIAAEMMGTAFTYDEEATLIAQTSSAPYGPWSVQYVYLPTASGPMPVAAVMDNVQYAVQADHLNTPRRLTSSNGQVMWQWGYSAFGEEAPTTAARRFMGPSTAATTGVTFNLRFPGQYADSESGLSYNGFRSYNATTGRYTQGDPIGLGGGWNRFGYVGQNPLMFVDPVGLDPWASTSGPATYDVTFNRGVGLISLTDQNGSVVSTYPAGNSTTQGSKGAWPDGTYPQSHYNAHPESGPTGPYGSNGIIVFNVPNRSGMGPHSGRSGPNSPTLGCIRTNDDAMDEIDRRTLNGSRIKTINVKP